MFDHVHHAELNLGLRIHSFDGFGKAFESIHTRDEDVSHSRFFNSVTICIQNLAPSLSAAHTPKSSFKELICSLDKMLAECEHLG